MVIWSVTKRRKEMFYLTTHSTHFIYGYMVSERNTDEQPINIQDF